jgi:hypothetical protein
MLERVAPRVGEQGLARHHLQARFLGEGGGALADEEDLLLGQQPSRDRHRVADVADRADRADREVAPVHQARAHLDLARLVQSRAAAGVEHRQVFQHPDRGFDGIDGGSAALEDRGPDAGRRGDSVAIVLLLARLHLLGAAMDDEGPAALARIGHFIRPR